MIDPQEYISKLPLGPGVYFFKNAAGEILYVGKATSLRDRVRSYFSTDISQTRGPKIVKMLEEYTTIDHTPTDSVLEALILEANLIKTHQPPYNTQEKDNKSYNYVVVTNERFPKILTVRGRVMHTLFKPENIKYTFGPFPHGMQLREAMKIIRKMFPYRDQKCIPAEDQRAKKPERAPRPCFNRQIGLCPGVCTGEITAEQYAETIKNLKLFFEGKKKELIRSLEMRMNDFAATQAFERADQVKRTIFSLNHIQDVALLKRGSNTEGSVGGELFAEQRSGVFRIEAYDIAHLAGKNVVGVMTVVEDGEAEKNEYRKFRIRINPGINDVGALKEIIRRRLGHLEWPLPDLIVVDGAQAQINAAQHVLQERGFTIPVVSVVKDEHHKARDIMLGMVQHVTPDIVAVHRDSIILANSESHRFAITYHRNLRRNTML